MLDRENTIKEKLNQSLSPEMVEICDDSHLHEGHAGAKDGRGHFSVMIVSDKFTGLNRLKRHRLIYEALGDLLETEIHALAIKAYSPDEI
ncbi:MAG: BolA family protein [Gammaproteobacteria bacterium]